MIPLFFVQMPDTAPWWQDIRIGAVCLTLIVTFAVNLLLFFFSPKITRYFFGPTLRLDFADKEPFVVRTDSHNWKPSDASGRQVDYKDQFIRVRVTNEAQRPAKGCRGYLASIKVLQDGKYQDHHLYHDFIPLKWSYSKMAGQDGKLVKPLDITLPHNVSDYLDIAAVYDGRVDHHYRFVELQLDFLPEKYKNLIISNQTYLLEIVVTADEAYYKTIMLTLTWNGLPDGIKAEKFA